MELEIVPIKNPDELNLILGQTHFIKTVEDLYEVMVTAVPGCRFGLAFCEASGPALVRSAGTDDALTRLAEENALALSAGHSFILMLGEGLYPVKPRSGDRRPN
jgi:adenosine/AMP kinase